MYCRSCLHCGLFTHTRVTECMHNCGVHVLQWLFSYVVVAKLVNRKREFESHVLIPFLYYRAWYVVVG